jgi:hypothetical protein
MQQTALDFTAARARRDVGMQRAVDHADRVTDGWREIAISHVDDYARKRDTFLAEDVIAASAGKVPEPPTRKAWGAVIQRAAREGIIEKIGFAPAKTSNCSPKVLWRSRIGVAHGA